MKILDISAGYRHIWINKSHPLVTFLDRRPETKPHIVCDTRSIPLESGSFDLIVFDPPHENSGAHSRMRATYGHSITADILSTVRSSSREAWRVSKPNALMAFKWNDCAKPLEVILPMLEGWEPLFGHGMRLPGRHKTQTYWVMLLRKPSLIPLPPGVANL